jgi:hypothetical protein
MKNRIKEHEGMFGRLIYDSCPVLMTTFIKKTKWAINFVDYFECMKKERR